MKSNHHKRKSLPYIIRSFAFWLRSLSFVKHILIFYTFITILGAILLFLPFSHNLEVKNNVGVIEPIHISFLDALFTSASAFSDTGLTTHNTAETWTTFGQAIIAVLIFIGGIGWFALKVYLVNIIFGRPLSFVSRAVLASERGSSRVGFSKELIRASVTILLIILVVASIVLSLLFYFQEPSLDPYGLTTNLSNQPGISIMIPGLTGSQMLFENPYHNVVTSIKFGIFHSISALNNAGFDIMGANSIAAYYHNYGIQTIFILLFVFGGIGYPVIYDLFKYVQSKIYKQEFSFSIFTKLSCSTYLAIVVIGISTIFAIETTSKTIGHVYNNAQVDTYSFWKNPMYGSTSDKTIAIFFNTLSTRNAGFSTIRMSDISQMTLFVYAIMMFIGSAPSSTAGGIRTTTFALLILGIWNRVRGRNEVRIFKRRISSRTVIQSYLVFGIALVLVTVAIVIGTTSFTENGGLLNSKEYTMPLILAINHPPIYLRHQFMDLAFEISSAFGTTGLSTGITANLSIASKISLVLLMFIGQLGVSSTILVWRNKRNKSIKYGRVVTDVSIG